MMLWLPVWLPQMDKHSKNQWAVQDLNLWPLPCQGSSGPFWEVCHCRTELNGEPLTCMNILSGSRWVWWRLIALAPICGSHWPRGKPRELPMASKIIKAFAAPGYLPNLSPVKGRRTCVRIASEVGAVRVRADREWPATWRPAVSCPSCLRTR